VATNLSQINIIAEASIQGQLVMHVLAAAPVVSGVIIFQKNKLIKTDELFKRKPLTGISCVCLPEDDVIQ